MLINVPFVRNPDEWHCAHAAIQGVVKHFIKDYYSLDYLNALMNNDHNLWVWPFQAVKALSEAGLFVRLFSSYDLKTFTSVDSIKASFPEIYAELTSIAPLKSACDYVVSNNLHEKSSLSVANIESFLHKGCVPIIILGSKKHLGKYVVITGFDAKNFYYHESGPNNAMPHKSISKEKFLANWMKVPSRNMAIIVYGKEYCGTYTRFNF